jgi:hypothetical protein
MHAHVHVDAFSSGVPPATVGTCTAADPTSSWHSSTTVLLYSQLPQTQQKQQQQQLHQQKMQVLVRLPAAAADGR